MSVCNLLFYLPGCIVTPATSPGQPNGEIVVVATDSESADTVKYNLNIDFSYASEGSTSGTFTGLIPGTYVIYARNSDSCRTMISLTVGVQTNYSILYRLDFNSLADKNETNKTWRLNIEDNQYLGNVIEVEGASDDPVTLSWRGEGNENIFDSNVVSAELTVMLNSPTDQYFIGLYTYDETRYRASLYHWNGSAYELFFRGFLMPMLYNENYVAKTNYDITLTFTDRLADLKEYSFSDDSGNIPQTRIPIMNALAFIINKTALPLNIWETVNFYENSLAAGTDDSTLEQVYLDPEVYQNSDGTMKDCLSVLQSIMDAFSSRLYQSNGRWNIDMINGKPMSAVPTRKRTSDLGVISGGEENARIFLRRANQPLPKVHFVDRTQMMSIPQTYGTIDLTYDYTIKNNVLRFGQFEIEDIDNGQFKGWSADLTNAPNARIGLEQLDEVRNGSKYAFFAQFDTSQGTEYITLQSLPIQITSSATDFKMKINFDVYTRPTFTNTHIFFDVAIRIGTRYLKPIRGGTAANQFTPGGGSLLEDKYFRFYIDDHLKWQTFSLDAVILAAVPFSGNLIVEFRFNSNRVYDISVLDNLQYVNPTDNYLTRYRVKHIKDSRNLVYFYSIEKDSSVRAFYPDIIGINATNHIWRLNKTLPYPKDSNGDDYESWLQSILLDNVVIQLFPNSTDPDESETTTEVPNSGVRQTYAKTIYHGDLTFPDDENYKLISRGYLSDDAGQPLNSGWTRRHVAESRSFNELIAKMMRDQYDDLRWKLSGTIAYDGVVPTFWNVMHETRSGRVYMFMALTLKLRMDEAEIEAIETQKGAAIIDESDGQPIVNPEDIADVVAPPTNLLDVTSATILLEANDVTFSSEVTTHDVIVEVTEAVVGLPAYSTTFQNSINTRVLTTSGTETKTNTLIYFDDVTATIVRTGTNTDVVDIFWYLDGAVVNSVTGITAGSTINESYTYSGLTGGEELKVTITEG